MPWLTLDFKERKKKDQLSSKYNVRGIPTFVLLDGDTGETISANARGSVQGDPEAENFPWK